jgi:D-3-phosphoglycerate dehydrogenase
MPLEDTNFEGLKKAYANGIELRGKPWYSRNQSYWSATAKMALGLGMKVIAADSFIPQVDVTVSFFDGQSITTTIVSQSLESLLSGFHYLTCACSRGFIIGEKELIMKDE